MGSSNHMSDLVARARHTIAWVGMLCLCVGLATAHADDADLKEGAPSPRHPDYVFEDELPRELYEVPGTSAGMFFGRHQFGDAFLGRWRADYLNYGWKNYENYRLNVTPYIRTYDVYGNYIADGYEVFALEEYRTRAPGIGSLEHKGKFYYNWLRRLIIADDSYGGWTARLMVGDFIHTTFTPLTLDMVGFNGVRFDAISTTDQRLTLLVSRISDPVRVDRTLTGEGFIRNIDEGVYLFGAHWETNIDDAVTLGTSYVNLRRFDGQRGVRSNTRKGLAPRNTVAQQIIVRFEDDSPTSGVQGAAIFDISASVTLAPPVDAPGEEERVVTYLPSAVDLSPGVRSHARYVEVIGEYRDADGSDSPAYVDYTFEVPEDVVKVEFAALVANDYRISIRQNHFYVTDPVRGSGQKRETKFTVIRRADGEVGDLSNKRLIHFDYGMASAVEVMGVNAMLQIPGLEVHGEIVRSTNHYQYPTLLGCRSKFDDVAGYLTIDKQWSVFEVGGEWFTIGPAFTSYYPHPGESGNKRTLGEVFYFNETRQHPYRDTGVETNNPYFALVDDNDNMLVNERPDNWLGLLSFPVEQRINTTNQSGTGIFPGFDLDQDGNPDTNRNRNEYPDYDEPFLMYFTDPEVFYFGDDFNNNFITDAWEDDDLPNYPYYKDEKGLHLVASIKPAPGLKLSLGRYAVEQLAGGGRNNSLYGKLSFDRQFSPQWRVRWEHESKDVQDDIANDYYQYPLQEGVLGRYSLSSPGFISYIQTYVADRLEARDSFVNRGLARVEYEPVAKWHMEAKFRYELNHQRRLDLETGPAQPEDDIELYGAVFRTDYTWWWRDRLEVKPRFKTLYRVWGRSSQDDALVEELQILPILRADFHLSPQTQLRIGVQGMPGLADRRRDFANEVNDSKRTSWTVMWFNEAEYQGYRIGTEVGLMHQRIDFDDPEREDIDFSRFFVRMITGVGTVVR